MKPCLNIESFFERASQIGGDFKKAEELLFNEIRGEINRTVNHMKMQMTMLED
jgi:hypothetical protein